MSGIEDERPTAVVRAEEGSDAWRAVVRAQRAATADHADFYALAGGVVDTLRALEALTRVLASQTVGYGRGRVLYDDQGRDPVLRLGEAAEHLTVTGEFLAAAERAADGYWSAVSHIGVQP